MNNIEKLLNEEKKKLDKLKVPMDMETRLRTSLEEVPKIKKKNIKLRVASLILAVILLGYNMDTLAFYGKKLVGYENIMSGTLKELNELGKGQRIDKSYTFKNGIKVTLDAIMLDDNNMVVFYTIYSPDGNVKDVDSNMGMLRVVGFGGRGFSSGGSGITNKEETEMKWVISIHNPPLFFEKSFKLEAYYTHEDGDVEYGEIPFKIDRSQAVGKSIKVNINKSIELGNRNIKIKSLVASPTSTVIKGQTQNILELGLDTINKNRLRPENIELKLIADGKEVEKLGGGMSTDYKGSTFDTRFDALPPNTKDIQLQLISFSGDFDVDEKIELNIGQTKDMEILEQNIRIEDVYEK